MLDEPNVHVGENTPEYIAYRLMKDVAHAEDIHLQGLSSNASREWILRTYAQCLQVVNAPHNVADALKQYAPVD